MAQRGFAVAAFRDGAAVARGTVAADRARRPRRAAVGAALATARGRPVRHRLRRGRVLRHRPAGRPAHLAAAVRPHRRRRVPARRAGDDPPRRGPARRRRARRDLAGRRPRPVRRPRADRGRDGGHPRRPRRVARGDAGRDHRPHRLAEQFAQSQRGRPGCRRHRCRTSRQCSPARATGWSGDEVRSTTASRSPTSRDVLRDVAGDVRLLRDRAGRRVRRARPPRRRRRGPARVPVRRPRGRRLPDGRAGRRGTRRDRRRRAGRRRRRSGRRRRQRARSATRRSSRTSACRPGI